MPAAVRMARIIATSHGSGSVLNEMLKSCRRSRRNSENRTKTKVRRMERLCEDRSKEI